MWVSCQNMRKHYPSASLDACVCAGGRHLSRKYRNDSPVCPILCRLRHVVTTNDFDDVGTYRWDVTRLRFVFFPDTRFTPFRQAIPVWLCLHLFRLVSLWFLFDCGFRETKRTTTTGVRKKRHAHVETRVWVNLRTQPLGSSRVLTHSLRLGILVRLGHSRNEFRWIWKTLLHFAVCAKPHFQTTRIGCSAAKTYFSGFNGTPLIKV